VRDEEVFSQGRGMVQIDAAFEFLKRFEPYTDKDLRFEVRIPDRDNARGVYLREPFETNRVLETSVRVNPVFHHDADNRDKVNFELSVVLDCDARWVDVADNLRLMHGGRSIDVRIDPRRLESGVHYTEILGYDAAQRERGPLFRVPITVVQPQRLQTADAAAWRGQMRFGPGEIERRFIAVPEGASWADIRLTTVEAEAPRRLVLHTVQAMPGLPFDAFNKREYIWMSAGSEEVRTIPVVGGRTIELCLAQYWSSLGEGTFDVEVGFHGLTPEPDSILLADGQYSAMVDVIAPLRKESLAPAASLKTWRQTLRPKSSELHPLDGARDQLPEQRQIYQLVLEYNLEQKSDGKALAIPALVNDEDAWDSWESLTWALYDKDKRLIAFGSSESDPVALDEGEYVLRFHVRSTALDQLEKLADMPIWIDRSLDALKLKIYADPDDVLAGGRAFGTRALEPGERRDLYIAAPKQSDLPKHAQPGDRLIGSLTLGEDDARLIGAGQRPGGYEITLVVPPAPMDKPETKASDAELEEDRGELEKLGDEVRDLKVARLEKLHGEKHQAAFDALAAEILSDNADHLPVYAARLHRVDDEDGRDTRLDAIVSAADEIIARIDREGLATHYGRKLDPDDKQAGKLRKEMDKQKHALSDALYRKGRALWYSLIDDDGRMIEPGEASGLTVERRDALRASLEATIAALQEWVDTTDKEYVLLHIAGERMHGRLGTALKLLNKRIADGKPERKMLEKRAKLLRQLKWDHWAAYEDKWLTLRYPAAYQPF
jgi:tripeptidyl-peptidase-2